MQISLPTLLFLIFLILKLTESIAWSWFWVFSPLLTIPALFVLFFFFGVLARLSRD